MTLKSVLPDGLYKVEISGFGQTSAGVVVMTGARLLGGDSSHYFSGLIAEENGRLNADILAVRHTQHTRPVFGPFERAHLVLSGRAEGAPGGDLVGAAVEIPALAIKLRLTPLEIDEAPSVDKGPPPAPPPMFDDADRPEAGLRGLPAQRF